MAKDRIVTLRITTEEKKLLEEDARRQERNISNLLLWCWKQWRGNNRQRRR